MIRYLNAGESHGKALVGIIEGMPAEVPISMANIKYHLARRQQGYGRSGRMAIEKDGIEIISGVRHGKTIGSPIAIVMSNQVYQKDKEQWKKIMQVEALERGQIIEPVTVPRPGHADLVGKQKYAFQDIRQVTERASARETAMRVACCVIIRQLLLTLDITILSHVTRIGNVGYPSWEAIRQMIDQPLNKTLKEVITIIENSPIRCFTSSLSQAMVEEIKRCRKNHNSVGGTFEILGLNLPPGLGSYVHWDKKLDGQLAQAVMSVQAIKGINIGIGFDGQSYWGTDFHDEITYEEIKGYGRKTNRAGGIEGGMTTGEPLIINAIMKPIPTLLNPLKTVDINSKNITKANYTRSDVCAVARAAVVAENAIIPVITNAIIDKFGGDTLPEIRDALNAYRIKNNTI